MQIKGSSLTLTCVFESVTRYREVSVSNEMCKTFIVAEVMIMVFFYYLNHKLLLPRQEQLSFITEYKKGGVLYGMSGEYFMVYLRRMLKRP